MGPFRDFLPTFYAKNVDGSIFVRVTIIYIQVEV